MTAGSTSRVSIPAIRRSMEARDVEPAVMRLAHMRDDVVQGQWCGVDQPRAERSRGEDRARHERARIETNRAALDQPQCAHRDQVGRTGAGADEMHGHCSSLARVFVPLGSSR